MRILCNDECALNAELLHKLKAGARICLEKEGIDSEDVEISLTFVSRDEIQRLNKLYRKIDKVTDVLSFPIYDDVDELREAINIGEALLGDVVICLPVAKEQAREYNHSEEREIAFLFIHSVCHLLGFDHIDEEEAKVMRRQEEEVLSEIGIMREKDGH